MITSTLVLPFRSHVKDIDEVSSPSVTYIAITSTTGSIASSSVSFFASCNGSSVNAKLIVITAPLSIPYISDLTFTEIDCKEP